MPGSLRVFVQARMSSRRFPGKVLAPFKGEPLIQRVLSSVHRALPRSFVVVATSVEKSDDPLVCYLESLGAEVFRGCLENTFERFRDCVRKYPCEWFLRINGDSPLLDPRVLQAVVRFADPALDLVTTIFPRTFPKGQNAELIRVSPFLKINSAELSREDQEHVTQFYYRNSTRFRIFNVPSNNAESAKSSLAVDSLEDLLRLEGLTDNDREELSPGPASPGKAGGLCAS